MSAETRQCFRPYPHPAHVWVCATVTGGDPGPPPTSKHVCPGLEPEPELDPAADQVIPSEMWDACVVPTWTRGDEVVMLAIESGFKPEPWQIEFLSRYFPEEAS